MAMASAPIPGEGDGVEAFFKRCGLPPNTRYQCGALVRELFPGVSIQEVSPQGYCSYTLCVGRDRIIQFRPPAHKLDIALAEAVRHVYGDLAPKTQLLTVLKVSSPPSTRAAGDASDDTEHNDEGVAMAEDDSLQACLDAISMTRMTGVSLTELRASSATRSLCPAKLKRQRQAIVGQFAKFVATGWSRRRSKDDAAVLHFRRKVGGSIKWRLEQMAANLPKRFRPLVNSTLRRLEEIVALPWVLTHGDIVPANIMVQPSHHTFRDVALTGLLDWAEAEYLPFGVGLLGLEELLGETDANGRFSYYPEAGQLRRGFWKRLAAEMPDVDLRRGAYFRDLVGISQSLGVLLWHGIAFDNGKLDRVVEEGKDDGEIRRLDLFTSASETKSWYYDSSGTRGSALLPGTGSLMWFRNKATVDPWIWIQNLLSKQASSVRPCPS